MKYGSLIAVFALGCGGTAGFTNISDSPRKGVTDKPTEWQIALRQAEEIEVKQDETILILKDNTASLTAIKTKIELLEASLAKSEPQNGKDGDPASAPNPPAKANTALAPLKVATPGDFSEPETLVELATRLYSQGVSVHMKTEQQLREIDAQMLGTKSTPVQYQSRPTYSQPYGTVCIDGQCFTPQRVSRKRR
jgi:hypothetical protein